MRSRSIALLYFPLYVSRFHSGPRLVFWQFEINSWWSLCGVLSLYSQEHSKEIEIYRFINFIFVFYGKLVQVEILFRSGFVITIDQLCIALGSKTKSLSDRPVLRALPSCKWNADDMVHEGKVQHRNVMRRLKPLSLSLSWNSACLFKQT